MRNGARTRGQGCEQGIGKLPAVGGRGARPAIASLSSLNAPTEPEPTISYEGGEVVACESGDHAKPHGVDGRPPEALPPRRGHQHGAAAAARLGAQSRSGRIYSDSSARQQRTYKGVDAYLVTRGANGYEFAPVGKGGGEEGAVGGFGGVGFFTTEGCSREVAPSRAALGGARRRSRWEVGTAVEAAARGEGRWRRRRSAAEAGAAEALAPSDSRSGVDRPTTPSSPEVSAAKAATAEQSC